uniref:UDP-N-acetylmuramoylalanine--D-glutamate ligase n=1 Tax=Dictyoglomus thermophilum TaxID=14 RepID=A0A7C3MRI7_DICTH
MDVNLNFKKALVLGLGISGLKIAEFLKNEGIDVIVNDYKKEDSFKDVIPLLKEKDIDFFFGDHPVELLQDIDLLVLSPGIPKTNPIYQEAIKRNLKIVGEIELAYWFAKVPIIAVTGTKGKSTTTTLIGEILNGAKIDNVVAGNIGLPFISVVKDLDKGYFVLEVSSFQLEDIESFRPYISVFTNIYPDHLDRYGSMNEYIEAKERIFMNQQEEDFAILNYDQDIIREVAKKYPVNKLYFSENPIKEYGIYFDKNKLIYHTENKNGFMNPSPNGLWNSILLKNFMAASLVGLILGIDEKVIEDVGNRFKGIPFALEKVDTVNGRVFINDSKATNPISTILAIKSINASIVLILGGRNKNFDFTELFESIKQNGNVKHVVLIGETKNIMRDLAKSYNISYEEANTLEEAVKKAYYLSDFGDVVLLSPACASFDMFENYKERGKAFNKIVERLKNEKI